MPSHKHERTITRLGRTTTRWHASVEPAAYRRARAGTGALGASERTVPRVGRFVVLGAAVLLLVVAGLALLAGQDDRRGVVVEMVAYGALVEYPREEGACVHAVGVSGDPGSQGRPAGSWSSAEEAANQAARALVGAQQVPALESTNGGAGAIVQAGRGAPGVPVPAGEVVLLSEDSLRVEFLPAPITRAKRTFTPVRAGWFPGPLSGESAGLAMGLSAVDAFVSGPLCTQGPIAATGVLSGTGEVGPVSDVDVKAEAAARAGMVVFMVPHGQGEQAHVADSPMRVVEVSSLKEAREVLATQPPTSSP